MMSSNFTSLRWWCWSCLSLQCVGIFIQRVWFPEFKRAHISRNTFQWLLPNIAFAIWKTRLRNLHYVQCLNIAPMEKAWFMALMEKELWTQWNIPLWFIAPMAKARFCEILFFQVVIVMVKDKKSCAIKDTISVKITFMNYRSCITWTKV